MTTNPIKPDEAAPETPENKVEEPKTTARYDIPHIKLVEQLELQQQGRARDREWGEGAGEGHIIL